MRKRKTIDWKDQNHNLLFATAVIHGDVLIELVNFQAAADRGWTEEFATHRGYVYRELAPDHVLLKKEH